MTSPKAILMNGVAIAGIACVAAAVALTRKNKVKELRGKVILITGSSRGLGLALAEEFGRRGANLVLTARSMEELNQAYQSLLKRNAVDQTQVFIVAADLCRVEEAERLIRQATEHFGRIDVLINNAGIITVGPIEHQTIQDFQHAMDTNFFSGVYASLAVMPQMLDHQSGTIVNIASIGGKVAVPHLLPYIASKFALVGFSQGLHAELLSKGVHILTVSPGLMRTGSHLNALFCGDAAREYRWFSFLASFPGISISVRRAARKIVAAIHSKETEIAITPQAILAARLAQTFPGLTTRLLGGINKLLPKPIAISRKPRRGFELREQELTFVTTLGWKAAQRYNQLGKESLPAR